MAKAKNIPENIPNGHDHAAEAGNGADEVVVESKQRLIASKLAGGIRDWILDRLRNEQDKRPWSERGEEEQRTTVRECTYAVEELIEEAVQLIAASACSPMEVRVESITAKDGVKVVLKMVDASQLHALVDIVGQIAFLVPLNAGVFMGADARPIKKDQADMGFPEAPVPAGDATASAEQPTVQ